MWAGVPREGIVANWDRFEPLIEQALEHTRGEMTARDVQCELLAGKWGLWVVGRDEDFWGILISHIYNFYEKRFCEIVLLAVRPGYTLKELRTEFEPVLEDFAREHACDALRMFTSRKGLRAALSSGWKEIYVEMERPLWPKAAEAEAKTKPQSNRTPPGQDNNPS